MTKLNNMVQNDYTTLFYYASSVLKQSLQSIRDMFPFYETCLMDNPGSGDEDSILEVRLDKEEATLSCTLDNEKKCIQSYLFPDDSNSLMNYINFLNDRYVYDYLKSRWVLSSCYVSVKRTKFITCFILYC